MRKCSNNQGKGWRGNREREMLFWGKVLVEKFCSTEGALIWSGSFFERMHKFRDLWHSAKWPSVKDVVCVSSLSSQLSFMITHLQWKLRLVESMQSIHNSVLSWRDNPISTEAVGSSCQVQGLPSFQASHLCSVLKLLQTQREVSCS